MQDRIVQLREVPAAMHLIAVGRMRDGPEATLFERYNTRLRPRLAVAEVPVGRGSTPVIKQQGRRRSAGHLAKRRLRRSIGSGRPRCWTAKVCFTQLGQWARLARPICFVIGGAEGLDAAVIERADYVLSLGLMTWPHFHGARHAGRTIVSRPGDQRRVIPIIARVVPRLSHSRPINGACIDRQLAPCQGLGYLDNRLPAVWIDNRCGIRLVALVVEDVWVASASGIGWSCWP